MKGCELYMAAPAVKVNVKNMPSKGSNANYRNYSQRSALNSRNSYTELIAKITRKLGLLPLIPHLPEFCNQDAWVDIIQNDTMVTFSRFFPYRFKMVINSETCDKKMDNQKVMWYYIKDEVLQGAKLLGIMDIDWQDTSSNNSSLGASSVGNYFYPSYACPIATFESIAALQTAADFNSLYNRGIYIDFQYPNHFCLRGIGNTNYDLNSFTVILLVEHSSLATISPTKMETFEKLAMADIAGFLYQNLKYFDGLETAFLNLDLKLSELNDIANKRDQIVEELDNAHVSTSNDNIPYLFSV